MVFFRVDFLRIPEDAYAYFVQANAHVVPSERELRKLDFISNFILTSGFFTGSSSSRQRCSLQLDDGLSFAPTSPTHSPSFIEAQSISLSLWYDRLMMALKLSKSSSFRQCGACLSTKDKRRSIRLEIVFLL